MKRLASYTSDVVVDLIKLDDGRKAGLVELQVVLEDCGDRLLGDDAIVDVVPDPPDEAGVGPERLRVVMNDVVVVGDEETWW